MSRVLDFADGFESTTEPLQGEIKANKLQNFPSDAAFVTAKGTPAEAGDIYFNTTDENIHVFRTVWEIVETSHTLDVFNLVSDIAANSNITLINGRFLVGANQLTVSLNGQLLNVGDDYTEVGSANTYSQVIKTLIDLKATDRLVVRN